MDNPDEAKTIINVKAVSVRAWERAKNAANRNGETMGAWLSRALDQLANLEGSGPREIPPEPAANLPAAAVNPSPVQPLGVEQVAALLQGMAAVAQATGVAPAKADVRRAYGLVDEHVRLARGMPPRPRRVPGQAGGKALALEGKAE